MGILELGGHHQTLLGTRCVAPRHTGLARAHRLAGGGLGRGQVECGVFGQAVVAAMVRDSGKYKDYEVG